MICQHEVDMYGKRNDRPSYWCGATVTGAVILVTLFTAACVKTDVVMLTPEAYPPVAAESVRVFRSVDDLLGAFEEIALIDVYMEGSCSGALCEDREDFVVALRERAGELGANGIVLDQSDFSRLAELTSGGKTSVQVLAIRTLGDVPEMTDVVMLTPQRYSPVAPDSVFVFLQPWEAPEEYEQLALIDAYEVARCSRGRCPRLSEIVGELKNRAGAIGANGIIIDGELAEIRAVRRGDTAVRVIAIRFQNPDLK